MILRLEFIRDLNIVFCVKMNTGRITAGGSLISTVTMNTGATNKAKITSKVFLAEFTADTAPVITAETEVTGHQDVLTDDSINFMD